MEQGKVTGANVSVRIDDAFMQAVIKKQPYTQQFPIEASQPKITKEIDANALWEKITHNAWSSAEPGVLFWDTIIRESIPDCYADLGFKTLSTNPCGEIPLCPYDSCRLLALNLLSYVNAPFSDAARFDFDLFKEHARIALRVMDDIIDLECEKIDVILKKIDSDPEDEQTKFTEKQLWLNIREKALQGRRTGIGITAEGDMLAALGLRYGSEEGIAFSVKVHEVLAVEVYRASVDLAEERGAFPIYDTAREQNNPMIKRIAQADPALYERMKKHGRRNIAMLTIAPTGSVSICAQTSSGIEPVFMVSYKRRRKVNPNDKNVHITFVDEVGDSWEEYHVFHPRFLQWMEVQGYNPEDVKKYDDAQLQALIQKSPYHGATSNDIDWVSKVRMQGAIQKWVDHSISVTVNLPNDVSEDVVRDVYRTAWESGCKGMTIYRDGSRSGVLISNEPAKEDAKGIQETKAPVRPKVLDAEVIRFQNAHEKWIAVIGLLNDKPYEIFTGKAEGFYLPNWVEKGKVMKVHAENGETRYDFQFVDKYGYKVTMEGLSRSFDPEFWNYAKLISGILRHGMPLHYVVDLVETLSLSEDNINTWKNGVVRALKKFVPDGTVATEQQCPECHQEGGLVYKEGCISCTHCGYSKCG